MVGQCKNCIGFDSMRSTTYASADGLREDGIKFKLRLCLNPEGNGVYGWETIGVKRYWLKKRWLYTYKLTSVLVFIPFL